MSILNLSVIETKQIVHQSMFFFSFVCYHFIFVALGEVKRCTYTYHFFNCMSYCIYVI